MFPSQGAQKASGDETMKACVLQKGRLTPAGEAKLAAVFDLCSLWRQETDPAGFLARNGERFAGLVTTAGIGADAKLLEALPNLKVIASRGVGYEKIDLAAARARNIAVANTPEVLTGCVADLAVGALLAVARRICAADRFVRQGQWLQGGYALSDRVHGKKLGIVGMGRIGRAIAKRAAGFDLEIRYCSRSPGSDVTYPYLSDLAELARWADFLMVSAPGGPATRHLISARILAALGPKGYLINVSRGSLVDEKALVAALQQGRIAGAALDVFAAEPAVPACLHGLENVVLLPHIASSTRETFRDMEDLVIANLQHFFASGHLLTPVR